jgi:hypothetical protein
MDPNLKTPLESTSPTPPTPPVSYTKTNPPSLLENLWSHGRRKVIPKCGTQFDVPNNRKSRKRKKLFGGEKWWIRQERRLEFQLHSQEDQDFSATADVSRLITHKSSESRSLDLTNYIRSSGGVRYDTLLSYRRVFEVILEGGVGPERISENFKTSHWHIGYHTVGYSHTKSNHKRPTIRLVVHED